MYRGKNRTASEMVRWAKTWRIFIWQYLFSCVFMFKSHISITSVIINYRHCLMLGKGWILCVYYQEIFSMKIRGWNWFKSYIHSENRQLKSLNNRCTNVMICRTIFKGNISIHLQISPWSAFAVHFQRVQRKQ